MGNNTVLISLDYSDVGTTTFLRVYPGYVEIRKPKYAKASAQNLVKALMGLNKHIYSVFPISDIERVEIVSEATRSHTGIIQFYLRGHDQSTANYFNLAFRTDAIQYWYKDREIVELMICFINAVLKMQRGEAPTEEEINAFIRLMEDHS